VWINETISFRWQENLVYMPIYEYRCDSCGARTEAFQKLSDKPLEVCSVCGAASLRKLMSAASFRLKGEGWYETDFKTGDKKKLAESDSKPVAENIEQSKVSEPNKPDQKQSDSSEKKNSSANVSSKNDSAGKKSKGTAESKKKE
tara:strand:+ start:225 stop:659 length:435 start_codon:yes stop_codon:yes gene_type:complete